MKLVNLYLISLIAFVTLTGCERTQRMVVEGMPADPATDETQTTVEAIPVKSVLFLDYPV